MPVFRFIVVGAVLMLGGCVPGNSPIRVTELNPIKDDCTLDSNRSLGGGSLDLSGLGTYLVNVHLVSDLGMQTQLDTNGTLISGPGVNNFAEEAVDFTYTSKNPIISFAAERVAFAGYLLAGQDQDLSSFNLIGPNALQKLRDNVNDPTQLTQLTVNFTIKGHLESGQPESAETVTFPITVFSSNPSLMCAKGFVPTGACSKTGIGSAGQDGAAIQCNP
jgi:hypothetical protein